MLTSRCDGPYVDQEVNMIGECERCQARIPAGSYELFDYCALCSKNLCDRCMEKGCCGKRPAESGMEDLPDDENAGT